MGETNFFYHRGPVREPGFFFGRTAETAYLFDLLRKGQNVSISGPRRIGKTSLLFQILDESVRAANNFSNSEASFLYLDGGTLDGLEEENFYGAIDHALGGPTNNLAYANFLDRLQSFFAKGESKRLILLIDEFELVAANPRFGLAMFNRLRGLTSQYPLQFVTASKLPLWKLTIRNKVTLSSPFFNIFAPLSLGLLEETDARHLLRELSTKSAKTFQEEHFAQLLQLAGTHPLFLQVGGFRAVEAAGNDSCFSESASTQIRDRMLADLEPHLSYYWNELTPSQRYELSVLPILGNPSQDLLLSGLIRNGKYTGDVVEWFVRRQKVDGLLQIGPFLMDLRRSQTVVAGENIHLTPTEYSLLRLFLELPGRVLTPEDIEKALWPQDQAPDPERARGVVKKLRAALGSAGQYLVNRRGQGYLLTVD